MTNHLKKTASIIARISFSLLAAIFLLCITTISAHAQKTFTDGQKVAIKDADKWYVATYKFKSGTKHYAQYSHTYKEGNMTTTMQKMIPVADDAIVAETDATYKSLKLENETSTPKPPIPVTPIPVNTSNDEVPPTNPAPTGSTPAPATPPPAVNPTTTSVIDVLFAYTKEAADEAGGAAAIKAVYIDEGVKLLNQSLSNSETKVQVRAVPMLVEVEGVKVPATKEDALALLGAFGKPDGEFAQVHKARRDQKADIICLIFNGPYTGAWANLGQLPASFNQSRAAMVTPLGAYGTNLVFAHEFAHNLGCAHQGETGATAYAAGYNPGKGWKTIEANGGYTIPYFSAPRTVVTKNPAAGSSAAAESLLIGDATKADCSKCIRENGPEFARFGDNLPVITAQGTYRSTLTNPATSGVMLT